MFKSYLRKILSSSYCALPEKQERSENRGGAAKTRQKQENVRVRSSSPLDDNLDLFIGEMNEYRLRIILDERVSASNHFILSPPTLIVFLFNRFLSSIDSDHATETAEVANAATL